MNYDKKLIQEVYIRVCKDSRFTIGVAQAANLVGKMLDVSPLEVWLAMPDMVAMEEIATGRHPVLGRMK